jgi:hypothetical protein
MERQARLPLGGDVSALFCEKTKANLPDRDIEEHDRQAAADKDIKS